MIFDIDWRKNGTGMHTLFITQRLVQSLPNITEVHYVDMSEISKDRAFDTMKALSEKFGFAPPQDRHYFEGKMYGDLQPFMPIRFHIEELDATILINLKQWFQRGEIDKTEELMPLAYQNHEDFGHLKIYVDCKDSVKFSSSESIVLAQAQITRIFKTLEQEIRHKNDIKVSEEDVLEYLRVNPHLAKDLKIILDEELQDLKVKRPDIIASWKYYLAFESFC